MRFSYILKLSTKLPSSYSDLIQNGTTPFVLINRPDPIFITPVASKTRLSIHDCEHGNGLFYFVAAFCSTKWSKKTSTYIEENRNGTCRYQRRSTVWLNYRGEKLGVQKMNFENRTQQIGKWLTEIFFLPF